MNKIKIITDSCADITKEQAEEYNISVLPMSITIGDDSYNDFYDINTTRFFEILKDMDKNVEISSAQVKMNDFYNEFKTWSQQGYKIICLTISSKGSGTFQTANIAKNTLLEEMECNIEIVDTMCYSFVYGRVALKASEMVNEGKDVPEIIQKIQSMLSNFEIVFVLDTLKFLKKGGRISSTVATIGEILDIKPVLTISDGVIGSLEKIRGKKRVIPRLIQLMKEKGYNENCELYVLYGGNREKANELGEIFKTEFNLKDIKCIEIGPAIALHTGPGALAGLIFKNS